MSNFKNLFFWRKQDHIRREMMRILSKGQKAGLLDEPSREMIENILDFSKVLVREIMVPRTEIIAVSQESSPNEIIEEVIQSRRTRIPVYRGTIDNIVGILNINDLLRIHPDTMTTARILGYLTKPYYIPETKNAHLLFHEFKNQKKHIAIVIDEYGGTSGLVTLENLLEEIVGEIRDEHELDADSDGITKTLDGALIFDGRTEIEKIEEYLNTTLEKGHYETLSGWILSATRRIPHSGEQLRIDDWDITIESADERSIRKVKIKKMESVTPDDASS
ncbi:MAG: hemolysin family protein [Smithellaceae bacterium]